jgi:hypothetical protein
VDLDIKFVATCVDLRFGKRPGWYLDLEVV